MLVNLSKEDAERVVRALYTLADVNRKEARRHDLAGIALRDVRKGLRSDANEASRLASSIDQARGEHWS